MNDIDPNKKKRWLWMGFLGFFAPFAILVLAIITYLGVVTHRIDTRILQLKATQASQFLAFFPPILKGQKSSLKGVQDILLQQGYVEKKRAEDLIAGEYRVETRDGKVHLDLYRPGFESAGYRLEPLRTKIILEESTDPKKLVSVEEIRDVENSENLEQFEHLPKKIASYFAGRVRTQNSVPISEIPTAARLAVMAIEDIHFLDHVGLSFRGIVRALLKDLQAMRFVEGGSTLTQQLMKNLFFSNEKAISRKFKEALFALITEARHSKEDILEAYLNEVYLGQAGTHEIHGVSEGAYFYFNRPISTLSLAQSALLAAIIQAPNSQDPYRYPDRTLKRRNLVLKRMLDAQFITDEEFQNASSESLGVSQLGRQLYNMDYFIDAVLQDLPANIKDRLDRETYTIYTTLNPYLQTLASSVLREKLDDLKKKSADITKRESQGIYFQQALISMDLDQCSITALQGGRNFQQTQFNRILNGKRQPGSLFKPFVTLAALLKNSDPKIQPQTILEDSPFEWAYENQTWSPKNYDGAFRGPVTVRQTLENSLNVPTAKLAQVVGITNIIDVLQKAGIRSNLPKVPSLSLGSAEVSPIELAESYSTLARMGMRCKPRSWTKAFDSSGNLVQENPIHDTYALPPQPVFQTVHILKGVLTHGTGRSAAALGVTPNMYAGKTGTTNEDKDAWFAGFSPKTLTLVWVGYDEQEKLGLTGSAAALPIWIQFTLNSELLYPPQEFKVPEGLKAMEFPRTADSSSEKVIEYVN